jgi:hypothetical protein
MKVLGKGGYGQVVELDGHRVCKIQYSSKDYDAGVSTAALREMVAMTQIGELRPGRMLLDEHGTSAIEIRRFHLSLLDWMRATSRSDRLPLIPSIMGDVARELFAAHSRGYIHRDVKPENVMLDLTASPPRAHLIDWGMSRNVFEEEAGSGPWTPGQTTIWYRAPEMFTGDAYGTAADMWAFGILLVELITGKCPFRGRNELAQLQHYIDVLGLPPADRTVLPKWAFDREERRMQEPERVSIWAQAAGEEQVSVVIDGLIRWNPATRTSARALAIHPLFAAHPHQHQHPSSPPHQQLHPLALMPLAIRPATDASLRHAIRGVVVPVCIRCNVLEGMVLWTAARFVARVIAAGAVRSRPHLGLVAVACVDLANKMVGTQMAQVLRRMRVHDAVSAQVSIVNGILGIAGLAEPCEVFMLRVLGSYTTHTFTRTTDRSLHTLPYRIARAIMDALLIVRPRLALTRLRNKAFLCTLSALGDFAAFGRKASIHSAVRSRMERDLVRALIHCTNRVMNMTSCAESGLWCKLHPHTSLLLRRDRVVRKRLVTAFVLMDRRNRSRP